MKGHTHAIFSFAGAIALNEVIPYLPTRPYLLAGALFSSVLGGLMPDIDSDESHIQQMIFMALGGWLWFYGLPAFSIV